MAIAHIREEFVARSSSTATRRLARMETRKKKLLRWAVILF